MRLQHLKKSREAFINFKHNTFPVLSGSLHLKLNSDPVLLYLFFICEVVEMQL